MEIAILGVEFSFNEVMYKQINRASMGSPLGPAFAGFNETKLFSNANKPHMYHCYVDNTFVEFNSKKECNDFSHFLHPSSHFTSAKECNDSFPFLDVLEQKSQARSITLVYWKPTFTGQYL